MWITVAKGHFSIGPLWLLRDSEPSKTQFFLLHVAPMKPQRSLVASQKSLTVCKILV